MPQTERAQRPVLRLDGITKRFGRLVANDAVSVSLWPGEVVALLGENGAGKTTLMNILFGHYTADAGTVEVFGQTLTQGNPRAALAKGVGMVHQHFALADNITVLENVVLGTRPLWGARLNMAKARAKLVGLAQEFGLTVEPDTRLGNLSVGERQRVEILKALYRDARILILDEPTAVLTPQQTKALFDALRKMVARGLSIIFISHKLHEVMAIANRVVVLRHGKLVGAVSVKDTDPRALAEMMVGSSIAAPELRTATPGPALLKLRAVSTPDRGGMRSLQAVDLDLQAGTITGLAGVSGNGQSALADLIAGLERPSAGEMLLHGAAPVRWSVADALAAGIARIPEDRHKTGTIADFSLTENAILERYNKPPFARRGWLDWGAARDFAQSIIASYDVRCPGPETRIRLLSGGNMQKLILGRAMANTPQIILANQPVRGLDIGAINFVQNQLLAARDRGAAVLLISEDLDEILTLSDVIHVISEGRLSPPFARGAMSAGDLGRWMAGEGFERGSHAA